MKTHRNGPSPLERALAAVDIPMVWRALNLPGEPGKSCRSPFREDRSPSFSIYAGGRMAKDHATGEIFDTVDFVAAALDTSKAEAARWLIEYAGTGRAPAAHKPRKAPTRPHKAPSKPKPPLTLPAMDGGTYGEICALQRLRGLPLNAGLEELRQRGILHFANLPEGRAFILTDAARRNAQARLLNGEKLPVAGGMKKAKTLAGAEASWPIGLADARNRETILLTEGGPDLLAVATAAWLETDGSLQSFGFCFMAGAGLKIPPEAVEAMAGKRIRLYGQPDEAGRAAARRWFAQLKPFAAALDYWEPDTPGMDINDYLTAHLAALSWGADLPDRLTPDHKETPTNTAPAGA